MFRQNYVQLRAPTTDVPSWWGTSEGWEGGVGYGAVHCAQGGGGGRGVTYGRGVCGGGGG